MQNFSASPREMLASFWRNKHLIFVLIKREVEGRYQGSYAGIFWSFINPIFMLGVYTFVFGYIFKARWPGSTDSNIFFAMILFCGLITFNIFAECVGKSPMIILANPNYVKKVVFPLEILPFVAMGSAIFHYVVGFVVWALLYFSLIGFPGLKIIAIPIIILPVIFFSLGISWFLSSLGVYIRDCSQIIQPLITGLLFLTPIFYPLTSLPEGLQKIMVFNPMASAIDGVRLLLLSDGSFSVKQIPVIYLLSSLFVAWLGFAWFQKTRKGFADVI